MDEKICPRISFWFIFLFYFTSLLCSCLGSYAIHCSFAFYAFEISDVYIIFLIYFFLPEKVEKELLEAESASIGDYIAESRNIANLHNQISSCDGILARMEGNHLGLNSHFTTQPGGLPNLLRHR